MKVINNMKEEWKDIKGYEGYYQVSNLGNIKSFIYFNGHEYIYRERILKPQNNRYLTVRLAKNKKVKQYTIHRLVAEYFISNEDKKPYVNHKDGNKYNNRVDNLEWCTAKENTQHAYKNNLIARITERKKEATLKNVKKAWEKTRKKINQYDLNGNFIKEYKSISEASKTNNIPTSSISNCCKKNVHTAGGYIWQYAR